MKSSDIIGMIQGLGCVREGGVCHGNTQVYQFVGNPSQNYVKIFYAIFYLFLSQIDLMKIYTWNNDNF